MVSSHTATSSSPAHLRRHRLVLGGVGEPQQQEAPLDQSILRGDLPAESARRERAERVLRVRAALRAEAARNATIGISRRHWWWPWSLSRDAPQNLPAHLPWEADLGHLKRNIALEQWRNSVHHRPLDREGAPADYPAGTGGPALPAASAGSNAMPSDKSEPLKEDNRLMVRLSGSDYSGLSQKISTTKVRGCAGRQDAGPAS
jgi:hypothetical protein